MTTRIVGRVVPITLPAGTKNDDLPAIYSKLPSASELQRRGSLVKSETPESLGLHPGSYHHIDTVILGAQDYHIYYEYRDASGRPVFINRLNQKGVDTNEIQST